MFCRSKCFRNCCPKTFFNVPRAEHISTHLGPQQHGRQLWGSASGNDASLLVHSIKRLHWAITALHENYVDMQSEQPPLSFTKLQFTNLPLCLYCLLPPLSSALHLVFCPLITTEGLKLCHGISCIIMSPFWNICRSSTDTCWLLHETCRKHIHKHINGVIYEGIYWSSTATLMSQKSPDLLIF